MAYQPLSSARNQYEGDAPEVTRPPNAYEDDGAEVNLPAYSLSAHTTGPPDGGGGARMSMTGTILPEPTFEWSTDTLTPSSADVMADSVNQQRSHARLTEEIMLSGKRVVETARHNTEMETRGSMTYDTFVSGLLETDEEFIVPLHQSLVFDSADIEPVSGEPMRGTHSLKRGMAVLTNRRLLLLSASATVLNEITTASMQKGSGQAYELYTSVEDCKEFYPIDITAVKTARFVMAVTSTASLQVKSREEDCFPCFCFVCDTIWFASPSEPDVSTSHQREVVFSIELPPWKRKTELTLVVPVNVDLEIIKNFVAHLQPLIKSAPTAANEVPAS
eukprot:m.186104 g.186104  ORF g.186104 m.186104 type:complete len:333 (+) comp16673_c0_seq1:96-1094(+)